jgi:hypothetical protein
MHIFNGQKFDDLLNESMQGGIDALYDIIDACKIKIGFVEDWEENYNKQDFATIPCWLEITLYEPSKRMDKTLKQMSVLNQSSVLNDSW